MPTNDELQSLYKYALSLTHNESFAFDLLHSAVEKVSQKTFVIHRKSYIKRVIRNLYIDEIRYQKRESLILDELEKSESEHLISLTDIEHVFIQKEQIESLLSQLMPLERELLYLWAVEGKTLHEISKETGTPRGTLTSRLARLRKKLSTFTDKKEHCDE